MSLQLVPAMANQSPQRDETCACCGEFTPPAVKRTPNATFVGTGFGARDFL